MISDKFVLHCPVYSRHNLISMWRELVNETLDKSSPMMFFLPLLLHTFEFCCLGNHYENLNDASLSVAAEQVRKNSSETAAPPTTERREELIKEVKTTRHSTQQKPVNQKSAAQIKKEAEEDARVKQVSKE